MRQVTMTTRCDCANCRDWDELIEHKKAFTATQLGLVGGRQAKADYIKRLRAWQAQECERNKEQTDLE